MFDIKPFYEAEDVADVINVLVESPDAEVVSDGIDALIRIREGKDAGRSVVSIHNIEALKGVRLLDNGGLWIGADIAFSHITSDALIQKCMPMLGDAVDVAGRPQTHDTGAIGSSICNSAISAGSVSTIWTLEADALLGDLEGRRTVLTCEFYAGLDRAVRQRTEVRTGFLVHESSIEGWNGYYIKYGKGKAMRIATLGCVVCVKPSRDGEWIKDVRLGYGVAGPTPLRCCEAEHDLKGRAVNGRETIPTFGKAALEEVNPCPSWKALKEFRLQLTEELSKRALAEAIKEAGGAVNA